MQSAIERVIQSEDRKFFEDVLFGDRYQLDRDPVVNPKADIDGSTDEETEGDDEDYLDIDEALQEDPLNDLPGPEIFEEW